MLFLVVGDFSILPTLLMPLMWLVGAATSISPMSIESGDFIVACAGKENDLNWIVLFVCVTRKRDELALH